MPLHDFVCARCNKHFEELIYNDRRPACPSCAQSDEVSKVPYARVAVGRKHDFRPPDIKSRFRPR